MAVTAVIFDIGGVLQVTPDLGVEKTWEARLGLAAGELLSRTRDIWAAGEIGASTETEVHIAVRDRLGIGEDETAAFMADLWRQYLGTANSGLISYLSGLRPAYRTGIISNSFVGAREREQVAYGMTDLVDEIVYSHETGMRKPDPRIYAIACERLGVRPADAVFIDDNEPCVTGARDAGLHAIRFHDNRQVIEQIEKLLTAVA